MSTTAPLVRAIEAAIDDVNHRRREVTAKISTAALDRFNTVIEPGGIDLRAFRNSPCVLWEHGRDPTRGRLPIGTSTRQDQSRSAIIATTQFGTDSYSDNLYGMYREGMLRGWSVFVIPDPKQTSRATRAEIRNRPELADADFVCRASELGEYSGVSVTGNPETLTMLVERGIWYPQETAAAAADPMDKLIRSRDPEIRRAAAWAKGQLEEYGRTLDRRLEELKAEMDRGS
jgi:hypothetical protein